MVHDDFHAVNDLRLNSQSSLLTSEKSLDSVPTNPSPATRAIRPRLAQIVFPIPVHQSFDYAIPEDLAAVLQIGHRVAAPFGHRGSQMGVVIGLRSTAPDVPAGAALKSLQRVIDPFPALTGMDLRLAEWIQRRYLCSLGQAVFSILSIGKQNPPKREKKKGAAESIRSPQPSSLTLTPEQSAACEHLLAAVDSGVHKPFLLIGVAASGKTEVYLRTIERVLSRGQSALYLVPEIGLTPQVERLLLERFGSIVCVWHSEISRGERWWIWRRVMSRSCRVLLGPRSAVFAPLKDLGLIVVDEEHDPSYKEDSTPRYHAREVALEKARLHNASVVFGSATPSMETYQRALTGQVTLLEMKRRVNDLPPPDIRLVDMRRHGFKLLSPPLAEAVASGLERKEQSILFLNRRGFATYVMCPNCDWEARCPHCGVSLVYHQPGAANQNDAGNLFEEESGPLRCHYCSHRMPMPAACLKCGRQTVKLKGRGTQRAVSDLKLWFPRARFLRWDRDSTRRKHSHDRAYEAVRSDSVDIVVGTQMIAQGLDFPGVTLVGVLDADRSLRFPDFRAGERTFQLLTQVAGRAGRSEKPGVVYLQTRHPDHYALQAALSFEFKAFAQEELRFRQEMGYPPYTRLILFLLRGPNADGVEKAAEEMMTWLENLGLPPEITLLGPAPSFYVLRAGFTQWQIMLKGPEETMRQLPNALRSYKPPRSVSLIIDADPEELQ